MDHEFSPEAQEAALARAVALPDIERALAEVLKLQAVVGLPENIGHRMFCTSMDRMIPVIAGRIGLPDVARGSGTGDACIVATEFYRIGGHSRVAEEISTLTGRDRTVCVLTDAWARLRHLRLLGGIIGAEPVFQRSRLLLGADSLVGKVVELYALLAALRPARIFLMAHHMDAIAPVALWPFRDVVEYVHHADHLPALGATVPWGRHVDLTWTCHGMCRAAGLPAEYVGLGAPRIDPPPVPRLPENGRLRIATCGQRNKYHGGTRHRWRDYAVAALSLPKAELLHIGPVDDGIRAEVAGALVEAGIDPARYVYLGTVPDLAATLIAHEVDVYLGSYPEGGGKATLEAMAAGLRPIVPIDAATPPLMRMSYPDARARVIASPDELAGAVAEVRGRTPDQIAHDLALVGEEATRFERYVRGV